MLVEEVRQQVLLVLWERVEQREEVCLVAEDELGSDDRRSGGLSHNQRRVERHVRQSLPDMLHQS